MINKVTEKLIEVLPDDSVIGQPFWTLMEKDETSEKGVNGSYIAVSNNVIPLYISKKMAIDASKRLGGVVRGVSQKHLKFLVNLSEEGERFGNMELCIILLDESQAMIVEPRMIRDYFLVDM
ncbi:hypothetical protein [Bacillus thuringiensis]|uniref:Uncharacterized protein n=1 Tax=Bacillus thuringiensis TaxID=1428 RepID=A0A9X6TN67_BACTU|nr:hypothetical protein [Bacillus thuringiensis]PEA89588.1 hypothetical protein CON71_12950 [Bacillus thuringiensis]